MIQAILAGLIAFVMSWLMLEAFLKLIGRYRLIGRRYHLAAAVVAGLVAVYIFLNYWGR